MQDYTTLQQEMMYWKRGLEKKNLVEDSGVYRR